MSNRILHKAPALAVPVFVYPLAQLGRELREATPALRELIRDACAGANGERPCVDDRTSEQARMRLNEAATHWCR